MRERELVLWPFSKAIIKREERARACVPGCSSKKSVLILKLSAKALEWNKE